MSLRLFQNSKLLTPAHFRHRGVEDEYDNLIRPDSPLCKDRCVSARPTFRHFPPIKLSPDAGLSTSAGNRGSLGGVRYAG